MRTAVLYIYIYACHFYQVINDTLVHVFQWITAKQNKIPQVKLSQSHNLTQVLVDQLQWFTSSSTKHNVSCI